MIKKLCNWILGIHPNSISFWETFKLTRLPIITFTQGDKDLNFIFDSGSDHNIIDSNVLNDIEHELLDVEGSVFGVNGKSENTKVCRISLSHKDKEYPANYLVCDMSGAVKKMKDMHGVNVHGLLGTDFFEAYKYVLDFNKMIAYSKA